MKSNFVKTVLSIAAGAMIAISGAASATPPLSNMTDVAGDIDSVVLYSVSNGQRYLGIFFKSGETGKKTRCIGTDRSMVVATESPYVDTEQSVRKSASA